MMGVQACKVNGPVSLTRHDCRDGGRSPWVETHGYDPTWLRRDCEMPEILPILKFCQKSVVNLTKPTVFWGR
jgi:hypothetical protein